MKKHFWLSLILALVLFFSGCPMPSFPLGSLTTTTGGGGIGKPTAPPYDDDAKSYGFYYDQLSPNGKTVYRAIYKGARKGTDLPFSLLEPLLISTQITDGDDTHTAAITTAVREVIQPAMDALAYDHPEIAWIAYGGEGGSSFAISTKSREKEGKRITEVPSLTFTLALKAPVASAEDIAVFEGELNAAVREILAEAEVATNRREKLALIQEALCARVTYDRTAERAHEAVGALLDGAAVCDGYAKAFKVLCDAADIPCVIIAGSAKQSESIEPHAWNYVQMEDGLFYAIDPTWNDEGEGASDRYFLLGASSIPALGRAPFALSHLPDGKFSAGEYTPFTFPTLSDGRYLPID